MSTENSVNYGGYGGVIKAAHYVPPIVPDITLTETEVVKPHYVPAPVNGITLTETEVVKPHYVPAPVSDMVLTETEVVKPHYIPAPVTAFIPCLATAILTKQDRELLQTGLSSSANSVNTLLSTIKSTALLRYLQNIDSNNERTFVMYTSSQSNDMVTYTSYTPNVDLDVNDGGYF